MEVSETRQKARDYLVILERSGLTPNFLMSEEYLDESGAIWTARYLPDGTLIEGFILPDEDEWLLPPLVNGVGIPDAVTFPFSTCIWFPTQLPPKPNANANWEFWDYQIIYDPTHFLHMEGHPWQTFRKNVKKYPARCGGELTYRDLSEIQYIDPFVSELMIQWGKDKNVFDPETMLRFGLMGEHRFGLFLKKSGCAAQLIGLNIWDENWKYVNFRYCIDDGSSFLQEYLRYQFYTDPEIQAKGKLVNDGGALDSEGLLRFKLKLNPVQVIKVYSLKPKV